MTSQEMVDVIANFYTEFNMAQSDAERALALRGFYDGVKTAKKNGYTVILNFKEGTIAVLQRSTTKYKRS